MEVLSFISTSESLVRKLGSFLRAYKKLYLEASDEDTAYYVNPITLRNEIYFHFLPVDLSKEFDYNYRDEDILIIKKWFGEEMLYSFEIQYRNEAFLICMIKDFFDYLAKENQEEKGRILLRHPHRGIINISDL